MMADRLTETEMLDRAAKAVGKIDYHGHRGIALVSSQEIEAMAATLVCLGMKPILPPSAKTCETS